MVVSEALIKSETPFTLIRSFSLALIFQFPLKRCYVLLREHRGAKLFIENFKFSLLTVIATSYFINLTLGADIEPRLITC